MPYLIEKATALFMMLASYGGPAGAASVPAVISSVPEYKIISAVQTSTPVRVKPAKPQVMHLDVDAVRVVVDNNPDTLSAVLQGNRSVILFPRRAMGAAHITVYGRDGKAFLARYIVIGTPEQRYIRLHETCARGHGHDAACEKETLYFCPNLCYQAALAAALPP